MHRKQNDEESLLSGMVESKLCIPGVLVFALLQATSAKHSRTLQLKKGLSEGALHPRHLFIWYSCSHVYMWLPASLIRKILTWATVHLGRRSILIGCDGDLAVVCARPCCSVAAADSRVAVNFLSSLIAKGATLAIDCCNAKLLKGKADKP